MTLERREHWQTNGPGAMRSVVSRDVAKSQQRREMSQLTGPRAWWPLPGWNCYGSARG